MESAPILDALMANGCRFVVIGSTARLLCGEAVVPIDLDIVVDASAEQRPLLLQALISVHAHVRTHTRRRGGAGGPNGAHAGGALCGAPARRRARA